MVLSMDRHSGLGRRCFILPASIPYRWTALLIAICISLPTQARSETVQSEKLRFETQAQAVAQATTTEQSGTTGQSTSNREQQSTGSTEQTLQILPQDDYGDDAAFGDDILIELTAGKLSLDVQDVSLNRVLTTVAEHAKVRILFVDPAQESITLAFTDLPLKKGLETLLKHRDHLFRYSGDTGALSTVAVYARKPRAPTTSTQRQPTPQPPKKEDFDSDGPDIALLSTQALGSLDEDERLEAVSDLADLEEEDQDEALNVLTEVLQKDDNSDVREAALESIADFDEPDSQRRAANLSVYDSEQDIRMRAVEILSDIEDWDALREVSVIHEDPEIRELATDALEYAED